MMTFFDFSDYIIKHTSNKTFAGECCCRVSSYFAQRRCYVTGAPLKEDCRQMHHRRRRYYGGKDTSENTIVVTKSVHQLVHSTNPKEIDALLAELNLTDGQFRMINQLRRESHMPLLKRNPRTNRSAA